MLERNMRTCPYCGVEFFVTSNDQHAYKFHGKCVCSYSCLQYLREEEKKQKEWDNFKC